MSLLKRFSSRGLLTSTLLEECMKHFLKEFLKELKDKLASNSISPGVPGEMLEVVLEETAGGMLEPLNDFQEKLLKELQEESLKAPLNESLKEPLEVFR